MNRFAPLLLVALALMLPACAARKHQASVTAPAKTAAAPEAMQNIVTPDDSLTAKVLVVNANLRFVVLSFPDGRMPKLDQHLFLYHDGLKAAEVKVVGPQQETSIVADVLSGEARVGDMVRNQ